MGINAPPGSGKSTLVQILKFIMEIVAGKELRVAQVGSDDLYMGKEQRKEFNKKHRKELCIETRLDPRSLDEEFFNVIADLKRFKSGDAPVKVPRFDKGADERDTLVCIEGPLDIIFYEGWRVGVQKGDFKLANGEVVEFDYKRLNGPIDYLMYLDAEPEDVWKWKLKSTQQDHDKMKNKKDEHGEMKKNQDWKPWTENDEKQLRMKWNTWMEPFLVQHEAKLMTDNIAHFVLTKRDAHHIVKTGLNNRQRLRSVCPEAEEMLLSPGRIKPTHRRYTIASSVQQAAPSPFKCAIVMTMMLVGLLSRAA